MLFPEGMKYDKQKREVRTPRVNEICSLIADVASITAKNKKSHFDKSSLNSRLVAGTGIEPVFAP